MQSQRTSSLSRVHACTIAWFSTTSNARDWLNLISGGTEGFFNQVRMVLSPLVYTFPSMNGGVTEPTHTNVLIF